MRRAVRIQFANESTTNQEFKMRGLLSVVLCLSMAICIMAVDFEMGEHQLGDYLETNRTIYMVNDDFYITSEKRRYFKLSIFLNRSVIFILQKRTLYSIFTNTKGRKHFLY